MSIKSRLTALRRELPDSSCQAAGLASRIARLRVSRQCGGKSSGDELDLCRKLRGVQISDGVILVERQLSAGSGHGRRKLGGIGACLDNLPDAVGLDPERLLFLDTETTGLCGGSGSFAFMVGMARLERGGCIVHQYLLTRFGGEQAMLKALADRIDAGDVLVTYNGKTFDLPLLATRFRMAGVADPLRHLQHLDLLYPVRRAFSNRWKDCRLASAERQLLGFQRHNDLPGAEAPAAWFDWIRQGDGGRLPLVCRHNQSDLLSLVLLIPLLAEIHQSPGLHGADPTAVARACRRVGREEAALALLLRHKPELGEAGLTELAEILKRRGQQQAARSIWMEQSERGDQKARQQLAKFFEHDRRDYRTALGYADKLFDGEGKQRRCNRLRRKLKEH